MQKEGVPFLGPRLSMGKLTHKKGGDKAEKPMIKH